MYYIARNYRSKFDAAGKAKMDCEAILKNNGWKNIGFKQTWISNPVLGTFISAIGITYALCRLKSKSIMCLQYPLNKFYRYILWGATLKKCTIITIVHDVYNLKGRQYKSPHELEILSKSHCLILHNKRMTEWFEKQNINTNNIELEIFDYLHTPTVNIPKTKVNSDNYRIVFAGNMGRFIYMLDDLKKENYKFNLYGVGFNPELIKDKTNSILDYKGFFKSNEIIDHIDGDFGLVWYGSTLETCDGGIGQYIKYNNPHKLSLYIQCNLPIIIWDQAGMASFVKENNIGITISSLFEISIKLKNLSIEDYEEMKSNVSKIKNKLSNGYYLSKAIKKATETLNIE